MTTTSNGVTRLLERLAAGESGELIFTAGTLEVHVLLSRGRIAWATDSAHPLELGRRIRERRGLDEEALREVVAECRRTQQPFGATLVAWGLATWDDVREALVHQIRIALAELGESGPGSDVFLVRAGYAGYESQLTFGLDELVEGTPLDGVFRAGPAPRSVPPRASGLAPTGVGPTLDHVAGATFFLREVDGRAPDEGAALAPAHVRAALADGAYLVVRADGAGAVVGARDPARATSILLGLRDAGRVRPTLARLAQHGFAVGRRGPSPSLARPRTRPAVSGEAPDAFAEAASYVVQGGLGVRAVARLDASGRLAASVADDGVDPVLLASHLVRRRVLLEGEPGVCGPSRELVVGEAETWTVALVHDDGSSTWLVTERTLALGAAWASLSAVVDAPPPAWVGAPVETPPLDFVQGHA